MNDQLPRGKRTREGETVVYAQRNARSDAQVPIQTGCQCVSFNHALRKLFVANGMTVRPTVLQRMNAKQCGFFMAANAISNN